MLTKIGWKWPKTSRRSEDGATSATLHPGLISNGLQPGAGREYVARQLAGGSARQLPVALGGRGRRCGAAVAGDSLRRDAKTRGSAVLRCGAAARHSAAAAAPRVWALQYPLLDVPKICTTKRKSQYKILWKGVKCKAASPFFSCCPSRPQIPMPVPTKEKARSSRLFTLLSANDMFNVFESPFQKIGRNCALKLLTIRGSRSDGDESPALSILLLVSFRSIPSRMRE